MTVRLFGDAKHVAALQTRLRLPLLKMYLPADRRMVGVNANEDLWP